MSSIRTPCEETPPARPRVRDNSVRGPSFPRASRVCVLCAQLGAAQPKPERLAWTKAEDATIIESVREFGLKWGRISENLPGRTAHAIRNRFHRLQTLQAEQAAAATAASEGAQKWAWEKMAE